MVSENIGLKIKGLLEHGEKVESLALGRMGDVVSVSDDGHRVYIRLRRSKEIGVTSFNVGDKVKLYRKDNKWYVDNTFEELNSFAEVSAPSDTN